MKKCIIFGAGSDFGLTPKARAQDLVIAADAGYEACLRAGIKPDLAVGDWDSAPPPDCKRVDLPVEKDDTDTLAAIKIGIAKGFEEFHIYCCTGGRIDHTFANLQCLVFLSKQNKRGFLYDENTVITAVTNGKIEFPPAKSGNISVFAADGTAKGVSIVGLKYSMENGHLTCDYPLGVSNSFVGDPAGITVSEGTVLVMFPAGVFPTSGESI